MNNYGDLILKYQSGEMSIAEREEFNRDYFLNTELRKEFVFQEKLDKVMKKSLLLEGIENDPNLIKAEILAQQDIDNYLIRGRNNKHQRSIVNFEVETEVEIRKRIAKAEVEMVLSGIDDISQEWVRSYKQREKELDQAPVAKRVIEYIKESEPYHEAVIQMPAAHRINSRMIFQVAAAVMVVSFLLFKSFTPTYSGDSVYKNYYEPMEANSYRLRGETQGVTNKLQEGVDEYLAKEYTKAEVVFDNLQKGNQNLAEVELFSGLNQMQLNNFQGAITSFTNLLAHEDQFVPEAQWYLGLCYIKTGDVAKAKPLFSALSETEGLYKKKAQRILKNLNR